MPRGNANSRFQMRSVNLEAGRPAAAQAVARMNQAVASARASGAKALKLIHGYGSSGKGGAIRLEVRRELQRKRTAGQIRDFIPGEEFSPFSPAGRCRSSPAIRTTPGPIWASPLSCSDTFS